MSEEMPQNKPANQRATEAAIEGLKTRELKLLTEAGFGDFLSVLEEINGEPLEPTTIERSREDFIHGLYKCLQIYEEGGLAGVAIVVDSYSAVHARKVLQLDELHIREALRGRGLGKALFDAVAEYAKKEDYMRLEWRTGKNNIRAQSLYSQYETDTDWIFYGMNLQT